MERKSKKISITTKTTERKVTTISSKSIEGPKRMIDRVKDCDSST